MANYNQAFELDEDVTNISNTSNNRGVVNNNVLNGRRTSESEIENKKLRQAALDNLDYNGEHKNGGDDHGADDEDDDQEENYDPDTQCGFTFFRPKWLQKFATKGCFMVIFSLLAVVQSMGWSYMTGTITTIQKRFKISSQTTGIVIAGNEVSQILFSVVLGYLGGKGHRPRWIAVGVLFSAASCLLLASPHLFYGAGNDALSLTEEYANILDAGYNGTSESKTSLLNSTLGSGKRSKVQLCLKDRPKEKEECGAGEGSIIPLVFIFVSQMVAGIGVLLFFSLGGPYLDDNVNKTNSPMLFGITSSLRLVGPTLGFLFASVCLKIFISPSLTPYVTTEDPRWLGAWWLGWIILGILMAITAVLISLFPKKLPKAVARANKKAELKKQEELNDKEGSKFSKIVVAPKKDDDNDKTELTTKEKLKELAKDVKSLVKNRINLFNNISTLFYIFSAIGYWTYMPKYLETIFMQTAVQASIISGLVGIASQSVGLLASGWLISKFQPGARFLAGWNVCIGFLYVIVKISFTQMGCTQEKFAFLTNNAMGGGGVGGGGSALNLTSGCNADCNCFNNKFSPVCDKSTNELYYSACHAGCTSFANGTISNCACLPSPQSTVTLGSCSEGCFNTFVLFLVINALIKLIDGSGRVGNILVSYRCVHPKDKALSISLTIGLLSAFALLPGPILFGYIFDSVCLVWGSKCGGQGKGNCWLYNGESLRYAFNLTAAFFTFMGAVFDCLVWYYVKDLDLYDEEKNLERWKEEAKTKDKK